MSQAYSDDTWILETKWTVSRARNTYGYNVCTLYVNGKKVAVCNGGGYDMVGTVLGTWIAGAFADKLRALPLEAFPEHYLGEKCVSKERQCYGLTFHDPTYDPGKARIGEDCMDRTFDGQSTGLTVDEAETMGKSFGLERYQAAYRASSPVPTERHTVPRIDGACGESSVEAIGRAIGLAFDSLPTRKRTGDIWRVTLRTAGTSS